MHEFPALGVPGRLAVVFGKGGLVVDGVDMGGAAAHTGEDHALGPRGEMRGFGKERILIPSVGQRGQSGQGGEAKSGTHGFEGIAAAKRERCVGAHCSGI